jgi:hypothetical protein
MRSITLKRRERWNSFYQSLSMDANSEFLWWKHLSKKLSSFFDESSESDSARKVSENWRKFGRHT